ncbi:MAG: SUMF1/EgtB/PvdO family nonheme iron enzyme [Bacteroidota bacterium]|jgi:formylglycine-generating enzyme required for sulfatase activity
MKFSSCFLLAIVLLMIALLPQVAMSNNIQVTTPVLTGQNTGTHYTQVQFTVTWDNSWRDVVNWDAAWVFVKYKGNDGIWKHATLSATGSDHTAPAGSTITPSSDGKGVFIYRSTNGSGSNSFANAKLHWNYGTDGVGDNDLITVKVFAVEMVYVPQASFYVGDGATNNEIGQFVAGSGTSPFQITGEGQLTLGGGGVGSLGNNNPGNMYVPDDFNSSTSQTLPASFPKGYNAFYCMKYEISQGQYADFLNTLTGTQASNRFPNGNGWRHTISVSGSVYSASRPDRACNFLSCRDDAAYADWSALRPMTEMEFEKACRGDQSPVANEYAWGTTNITAADAISGTEDGTETITTTNANCCFNNTTFSGGDGGLGPLRCGIFAKNTTTREQAGASYYGVMEMSGNLWERLVCVGNSTGRSFTGAHGDGALDGSGDANVSNWPGTNAVGTGYRGGSCDDASSNISHLRTSDREYAGEWTTSRGTDTGFRCVRTDPAGPTTLPPATRR